jgi:hypothetical protein
MTMQQIMATQKQRDMANWRHPDDPENPDIIRPCGYG